MKNNLLLSFPYFRIGGAENLIVATIEELYKKGIKFKILTLYIDQNIIKELEPYNFLFIKPNKHIEEKMKNRMFRYFLGLPVYLYLHYKNFNQFNKFLCFGTFSTYTVSLINLFIKRKIDIFYFECDVKIPGKVKFEFSDPFQNFTQFLMLNFQDFLDQIFLKQVNGIITIDDKNLEYAKIHYSSIVKKFFLIYPPLNLSKRIINEEKVSNKIKEIFESRTKYLSIIGTLDIKKNTIEALYFLKYLISNNLNYKLIIVGTGELENDLKNYCQENNLADFVFFTGKVNFDELSYIYKNIYCNLFFAKNQTWGLTPFEALIFNKPSIVSIESGCAEFLRRKKINYIYKLDSNYKDCLEFLQKKCSNFDYDKEKLEELYPENYIKKLLSIIF